MATNDAAGEPTRRRVQSIEVGLRVLDVLRMADGPQPLRKIAAAAQMPSSKAHLYLVSFVREEMAHQDSRTGYYGLGPLAIQLGLAAIRQLDVVEFSRTELDRLRDETGCAVYLTLWGDRGPCIVAKSDGNLQGAFAIRLGYILPLMTSATGLVFLTYLPRRDTEAALGADAVFKGRRPPDLDTKRVQKTLSEVRTRGYASTAGNLNTNFTAIAAPVFDYSGQAAAVLTVLGPGDYLSGNRYDDHARRLLDSTHRLSALMGRATSADVTEDA